MGVSLKVNGNPVEVSDNYTASDLVEFLREADESDSNEWIDLVGPGQGTVLLRTAGIFSIEVSDKTSVGVV